jgi:hypothetical protein
MAIDSVGSATYTSQQLMTNQTRQSEQTRQAEQTRRPDEAGQAERTTRDNEAAEGRPAQPVVNVQGQVTGKVINTVA